MWRPPSAAESAAHADAAESHRSSPPQPRDFAPVGQGVVVKVPGAGIAARAGAVISSAVCIRVVEVDGASGTKTLVDTDEEIVVHNLSRADVPGTSYIMTHLSADGTRYAGLGGEVWQVVTDVRVTGVTIQIKTRDLFGFWADDESSWTTIHTGTTCP